MNHFEVSGGSIWIKVSKSAANSPPCSTNDGATLFLKGLVKFLFMESGAGYSQER